VPWTGTRLEYSRDNATYNGSLVAGIEDYQIIFGAYFFYNEIKIEMVRDAFGYYDLISEIGGLMPILFIVFGGLGGFINT